MSNPQAHTWRKSSHSFANGNCVEVAWHKASGSYANQNCVEAGPGACGMVHVRDSKDPDGPVLTFTAALWAAFTAGVKDGQLDPGA
jgi:Domain of unknown function (DUF397)